MCLLDIADKALVDMFRWRLVKGYALAKVPKDLQHLYKTKHVQMHVLILKPRAPLITNHRNSKKLDNRRFNLEENTHSENSRSALKQANTFSKYKGVYASSYSQRNPFVARINFNYKTHHLGLFPTQEAAARAYNAEALAHGFILKTPNLELEI